MESAADLAVLGEMYNEDNLFQQEIPEQLWQNITNFIQNLRDLPVWKDRSMAATIFGGKQNYDFWKTIFSTAQTPDGTPALAKSLNILEMIKK